MSRLTITVSAALCAITILSTPVYGQIKNVKVSHKISGGTFFPVFDSDGDTTDDSFSIEGMRFWGTSGEYEGAPIDPTKPIVVTSFANGKLQIDLTNIEITLNGTPGTTVSGGLLIEADWMHGVVNANLKASATGAVTTPTANDVFAIDYSTEVDLANLGSFGSFTLQGSQPFDGMGLSSNDTLAAGTHHIVSRFDFTGPAGGKIILPNSFTITIAVPTPGAAVVMVGGFAVGRRRRRRADRVCRAGLRG